MSPTKKTLNNQILELRNTKTELRISTETNNKLDQAEERVI